MEDVRASSSLAFDNMVMSPQDNPPGINSGEVLYRHLLGSVLAERKNLNTPGAPFGAVLVGRSSALGGIYFSKILRTLMTGGDTRLLTSEQMQDKLLTGYSEKLNATKKRFQEWKKAAGAQAATLSKMHESFENDLFKYQQSGSHWFSRFEESAVNARAQLDNRLLHLILQYHAILEEERRLQVQLGELVEKACVRDIRLCQAELYFQLLTQHLDFETKGRVHVENLSSDHPQFIRCRNAVAENTKGKYFQGTNIKGINVLNVVRLKNQLLLEKFHQRASSSQNNQVKGLFCAIDSKNLERVIVHGFSDVDAATNRHVFQGHWEEGGNTASFVQNLVSQCTPVKFPKLFSRYSTLDENRKKLNDYNGDLQFIFLCRVLIGNVSVRNSEAPIEDLAEGYNTMYNPTSEEFTVFEPLNVLPEFLLQFEYITQYKSETAATYVGVDLRHRERKEPFRDWTPAEVVKQNRVMSSPQDAQGIHSRLQNAEKQRESIVRTIRREFSNYWHGLAKVSDTEMERIMHSQAKVRKHLQKDLEALAEELKCEKARTSFLAKEREMMARVIDGDVKKK